MYTHKCPSCGKFTGWGMDCCKCTFGETTGSEYLYCDDECYQDMEFPWYFQEQDLHEE